VDVNFTYVHYILFIPVLLIRYIVSLFLYGDRQHIFSIIDHKLWPGYVNSVQGSGVKSEVI